MECDPEDRQTNGRQRLRYDDRHLISSGKSQKRLVRSSRYRMK